MDKLRPNQQRGRIAVMAMAALILVYLIIVIHNMSYYMDQNPLAYSSSSSLVVQILNVSLGVCRIAYFITFIMWFRRAYYNLHQITTGLYQSEGWAAGAWFVPLVNFYMPFMIMKDLFKSTQEVLSKSALGQGVNLNLNIVSAWWFFHLLPFAIGILVMITVATNSFTGGAWILNFNAVSNLIAIPVLGLGIYIIQTYSKAEQLLPQVKSLDFSDFGESEEDINSESQAGL